MNEILNKVAELKELARKAEELALEIHGAVVSKKFESREAMFDCLGKGKDMDKQEYQALAQESQKYDDICSWIETATYKLSKEVIENLEKIA